MNQLLFDALPTLNCDESKSKKRACYRAKRTTTDEVANMFETIWDVNWTLSDFLYYTGTFQSKDGNGKDVPRTI